MQGVPSDLLDTNLDESMKVEDETDEEGEMSDMEAFKSAKAGSEESQQAKTSSKTSLKDSRGNIFNK